MLRSDRRKLSKASLPWKWELLLWSGLFGLCADAELPYVVVMALLSLVLWQHLGCPPRGAAFCWLRASCAVLVLGIIFQGDFMVAGGFTVLAALAFHDVFAVGASRYGVADLEALATDTHKFEARYLDRLVGPYPEAKDVYVARSPIHSVDSIDCPMVVLQGQEDEVVPPNQAEMIVAALAAKGLDHEYVLFDDEGHGFRKAENIITALEAEEAFFARTLGFTP